jgi:UDP-N-acetyl-D-galactosamine dehydrogenase
MLVSPPPPRIAVIGLGYVGLPLTLAFAAQFPTLGYDHDARRVDELRRGHDRTRQVPPAALAGLTVSSDPAALATCTVFVVTVPTPVDAARRPDLSLLLRATRQIGAVLKPGDCVIYESTVYPGCTEEDCLPVLEAASGLRLHEDFWLGYSPERINPGEGSRALTDIVKVTAGAGPAAAAFVDSLYRRIIRAGTHRAPSIRVAEASKAIENAQRDVNISFVNELALLFDRLGLDTEAVLAAAATKWNFLPFRPGLVGGHCISVDPYYLLHKAEAVGYRPEVLLSGRRVNDEMGRFVAGKAVKLMIRKGLDPDGGRALVLGLTYKENCPDTRNTKVLDVVRELEEFSLRVDVHDPWADPEETRQELGVALVEPRGPYDVVILAVAHRVFETLDWTALRHDRTVVFDVKGVLRAPWVDGRL